MLDSLYKNFIISLLIVTVGSKDISLEQPINNNNIKTIVSGEYTQPVPYLFLDKTGFCVKAIVKEAGNKSTPSSEFKCFPK